MTVLALHSEACNLVNAKLAELGRRQIHPSQRFVVKATLQALVAEGHTDLAEMLARVAAAPAEEFEG